MAHDVFISFSFKDQEKVDKIVNHLINIYNIPCWICTEKIRAGKNFYKEIINAIKECKLFLLVQTKASAESREVGDEVFEAIAQNKTIVPFIIEESVLDEELEFKLRRTQHVDGRKDPFDERIKELAQELCRILNIPFSENGLVEENSKPSYKLIPSKIQYSTNFYGRDDVLDNIHEKFSAEERIVFLKGMGGIGKSEIAKQYVKRYKNEYAAIVWMRYDGSLKNLIIDDSILTIEGLCRKTKADNSLQTDEEYANEKLGILSDISSERTLLIVDNYDTTFDNYLAQFVSKGAYRILFTTRMEQERRRYSVIPINEIDDENALKDMFIGYCNPEYIYIDKNDTAFPELFELTNRHTLTLELIAQYMEEANIDLLEMVARLKQNGFNELSNAQIIRNNEEQFGFDYIRRIFYMAKLSPTEKQFMRYMTLMPKHGISEQFFKLWCGDIYTNKTSLQKKSWIKYDAKNKILSLHPIIYEVVKQELQITYDNCKDFFDLFLETVEEERHWNASFETKQIMYACCQNIISKLPLSNDEMFELYYGMVHAYIFVANYSDGIKYLDNLYNYLLKRSKADTAMGGKVLFKIGWFHLWKGNFIEARNYLEDKAYPTLKKHMNVNCANEYTHCMREIGSTYYRMHRNQARGSNNLDKAEMYYRGSFSEIERIMAQDGYFTLEHLFEKRKNALYMNLGRVLVEKREFAVAKEYLFKAKEWFDKQSDKDGDKSSIYFSLGDYCIAINDPQAVEYLKIAMEYSQNTLTRFSFSRMEKNKSLAKAYEIVNDYVNALEAYKEMYEIAKAILVSGHPMLEEIMKTINELTLKINV